LAGNLVGELSLIDKQGGAHSHLERIPTPMKTCRVSIDVLPRRKAFVVAGDCLPQLELLACRCETQRAEKHEQGDAIPESHLPEW
jgi:hypothetical protein